MNKRALALIVCLALPAIASAASHAEKIDKTLGALKGPWEPMAKSQRLPLLDAAFLSF